MQMIVKVAQFSAALAALKILANAITADLVINAIILVAFSVVGRITYVKIMEHVWLVLLGAKATNAKDSALLLIALAVN